MKVYGIRQSREGYLETQIARSRQKFDYCKVSMTDVVRYRAILERARNLSAPVRSFGPVLCLGTRNGREVDLFRVGFFASTARRHLVAWLERSSDTSRFRSVIPPVEGLGRSTWQRITPSSVIGVEVNAMAARADVWIGSFDDMPADWTERFGVVFSNAFDQSQDPFRTAKEWWRVLRPGGYLVFCYGSKTEPNVHDPVGGITAGDVRRLFQGTVVHQGERATAVGYNEIIVRKEAPAPSGAAS